MTSCTVTWRTTLKTGGIVVGLCEQDAECKRLLSYWNQTPKHLAYVWSRTANTNPEGVGVADQLFARQDAIARAREALRNEEYKPTKARVEGGGWNWILIDPRSGEYDSGENDGCVNGGLKDWRTR